MVALILAFDIPCNILLRVIENYHPKQELSPTENQQRE